MKSGRCSILHKRVGESAAASGMSVVGPRQRRKLRHADAGVRRICRVKRLSLFDRFPECGDLVTADVTSLILTKKLTTLESRRLT